VKARVIVNPTAGRGAALTQLPTISDRMRQLGRVDIALTSGSGDAERLAAEAAAEDYTHLVAVGGDGTLNEVLNGACRGGRLGGMAFGVVPMGTGNDFARVLGVHDDLEHALATLIGGVERPVDLGSLNGRLFINASAGGFVAEVSEAASSQLKTLAGRLAYLIAGTGVLLEYEPATARVACHNGRAVARTETLHMFVVANARTIGGGHLVTPRASIDDGLLDVCLVHSTTTADFVALLAKISRGEHLDDEHVSYFQVPGADLEFDRVVKVNTDGEVLETERCSYRVLKGAARFLSPPSPVGPTSGTRSELR
jgi:diacylglycerol kinase (ATP)